MKSVFSLVAAAFFSMLSLSAATVDFDTVAATYAMISTDDAAHHA